MIVFTYIVKAKVSGLGTLTTSGIIKAENEYAALHTATREGREHLDKAGIAVDKLTVEVTAHPEIQAN